MPIRKGSPLISLTASSPTQRIRNLIEMTETEVQTYWNTHTGNPEWHPSEWVQADSDWHDLSE